MLTMDINDRIKFKFSYFLIQRQSNLILTGLEVKGLVE